MTIESKLILSVLKLTKKGAVQKDLVAKDTHSSTSVAEELLKTLCQKGFIQLKGSILEVEPGQRLQLVIEAIKQGVDIEHASKFLEWKEFEKMAAEAFEINGYLVNRNFHFKGRGKRWEIDLLARKRPLIACIDCKHWQHGWSRASVIKTTGAQVGRTKALTESLQDLTDKLELNDWTQATLIPVMLSLVPGPFKFHDNAPIVPILQLQSFISELPAQVNFLTHFSTIIKQKSKKLTEFQQFLKRKRSSRDLINN
jgi:Holliday junction resolvase-like predicted endonuclease